MARFFAYLPGMECREESSFDNKPEESPEESTVMVTIKSFIGADRQKTLYQ